MRRQDMLRFEALAGLTPAQLEKQQPELFGKIRDRLGQRLHETVTGHFAAAPEAVREVVARYRPDDPVTARPERDVAAIIEASELDEDAKRRALGELARLQLPATPKTLIHRGTPIATNPLFVRELAEARSHRLGELNKIGARKVDAILGKGLDLPTLKDGDLAALVAGDVLDVGEARSLGLGLSLYRLLDEDPDLVAATQKVKVKGPTGRRIAELRDLTHLDAEGWSDILATSGTAPPVGLDREGHARLLERKVAALFPTEVLMRRVGAVPVPAVGPLRQLDQLIEAGNSVATHPDRLELTGVPAGVRKKLRKAHHDVHRVAVAHPGLRIAEIADDTSIPADQRAKRIEARVGAYDRLLEQNRERELLHLDLSVGSQDLASIEQKGIRAEDRPLVIANLKAHQRMYSVAGDDAVDAAALLSSGFASSAAIVSMTKDAFVASVPLQAETAAAYYDTALLAAAQTGLAAASIHDAVAGGFGWLDVDNIGPDIQDYFRRIDGWQELFGEQTYCACTHCRSVLSPAAYFADLMGFVENHILDEVFVGDLADHVLALQQRRPDLWTLELTCENTNTEIPLLVVINEILETYLANREGFAGDLADRQAVGSFVYRDHLATTVEALSQPMVLPHEVLQTYLGHFSLERADLVRFVATAPETRQATALAVPRIERDLIAVPNDTKAFLQRIYGTTFTMSGDQVQPFDSQVLVRALGVDRDTLGAVVASRFVTDWGGLTIHLRGEKRSEDSVQNDVERVHGLTLAALDRMHRLLRLQRATGWDLPALDAVDQAVRTSGRGADLTGALDDVTEIARLAERFGEPVERVASLLGEVCTVPALDGRSLFDRRFNATYYVERDGAWPSATATFVHPAHATDPDAQPGLTLGRLRAGLGVSEPELAALVELLAVELGADLDAADDGDRAFALTEDNLGRLFRHAVVAEWLGLTIAELAAMLELAGAIAGTVLATFDDVLELVRVADMIGSGEVDLAPLRLAAGVVPLDSTPATDPAAMATRIVERISSDGLEFAATVFTAVAGVTDTNSQAIIAANPGAFEPVATTGRYRLADDFDPTAALAVPAGLAVTSEDLLAAVMPHHAGTLVVEALAAELAATREVAGALLAASGLDTTDEDVVRALTGAAAPTALLGALGAIIRFVQVLDPASTDVVVVVFAAEHLEVFGAPAMDALTVDAGVRLSKMSGVTAEELAVLAPILLSFEATDGFDAAPIEALSSLLELTPAPARAMQAAVTVPDNAIDALEVLLDATALCGLLGVTAQVLLDAASDDLARLDAAAGALVAAMRVVHPDDADWRETAEPYEAAILNAKRDGLTAYLIESVHPEFGSLTDLYHYFLLDPEVDGCFPTSRVVAAISSVQAYVHRVLMNLEQSDDGALQVSPDLVPRDEWDWRKNYRVWEANRKVFLWTENYLDPDVRDDVTPLFEDFEAAVLQNELDDQSILDAYARYMEGFEVLANLSIAGSYHDIDDASRTDVLHLIGVTPGDPPTFYYRTVENLRFGASDDDRVTSWEPWQPMDVKIPVRECSPVVHDGRLHVFWVEIVTTPENIVQDAGSKFVGYTHRLSVKFSTLRLDGHWTVPQAVSLYRTPPFAETDGLVDDPLIEPEERAEFSAAIADLFGFGTFSLDLDDLNAAVRELLTPRYDDEPHTTAREGYTLATEEWTRVYPESTPSGIRLSGAGYQMRAMVDLFSKDTRPAPGTKREGRLRWAKNSTPPSPALSHRDNGLYYGLQSSATFDDYAWAALVADQARRERVLDGLPTAFVSMGTSGLFQGRLANLRGASVHPVNGSLVDAVIDRDGDLLLFQGSARPGQAWAVQRIGTTLARVIARRLFVDGLDGLLATEHQESLGEASIPIQLTSAKVDDEVNAGELDFTGPFGVYYREIFFHLPFLIGKVLQGQRNHAEAKRWYEYLFDPTSTEVVADDSSLTDEQNAARRRDRNWRYAEFRNLGLPQLRQILTDSQAIATYRQDPFNPHAIARLRLSAYQKSVVMAYVDNLLDWGDQLFTRFQQESINEAIVLYQTARDILGPRPVQIGDCGLATGSRSYRELKPALEAGSEFLAELEHIVWIKPKWQPAGEMEFTLDAVAASAATYKAAMTHEMRRRGIRVIGESHAGGRRMTVELAGTAGGKTRAYANLAAPSRPVEHLDEPLVNIALAGKQSAARSEPDGRIAIDIQEPKARFVPGTTVAALNEDASGRDAYAVIHPHDWKRRSRRGRGPAIAPHFVWSFVRQVSPVFCIPGNTELLAYWDRVDDRLYKIHHCLDITGQRRQLSLFAPEIDPRALIRAKAAGLSTDDILDAVTGAVPPLRFSVLLDRAKQYAGVVQSFGSALQSALERKDGEELNQLRLTHQRDVLNQTTRVRQWEYDVAARSLEAAEAKRVTLSNSLARLEALRDGGLIAEEWTQRIAQHTASGTKAVEATLGFLAGALHFLPQLGSPFAMKYGGMETGNAAHNFAVGTRALGDFASAVASSAALEATFSRRAQGWDHQIAHSRDQLAELDREIAAATLRRDIAERAIELHDLAIEQAEEVNDATKARFSDLGFYTWLAASLQKIHRDAYNCALSMARMAERAFRFERNDQVSPLLSGDYWSPSHAGLLAGSQLLVELQQLEKRHLESVPTELEIDQTFSLFQMEPARLVELRQTGSTVFEIPEHFFDIHYPGHYRRRIRAVRLTIPCVTGPHANVSATLTLEDSRVRVDPDSDAALQHLAPARVGAVATSTGQNDAGVFELNFHGQTYLPFEGAGAISRWRLTLPDPLGFPPFDYRSISDVLLRLSYTAEHDGVFTAHVQQENAALAGTLAHAFDSAGLQRVISLRQEHAGVYQRLVAAPTGTAVDLEIGPRHFPVFVAGRDLEVTDFRIAVVSRNGLGSLELTVDGHDVDGFGASSDLGGIPEATVPPLVGSDPRVVHTFEVVDAGDIAGDDGQALDDTAIEDILVVVGYTPGDRR